MRIWSRHTPLKASHRSPAYTVKPHYGHLPSSWSPSIDASNAIRKKYDDSNNGHDPKYDSSGAVIHGANSSGSRDAAKEEVAAFHCGEEL